MTQNLLKSKKLIPIVVSMIVSVIILLWGYNYISSHGIAVEQVQQQQAVKLKKIRGEVVFYKENHPLSSKKAIEGQEINDHFVIETKAASNVLIEFGNDYECRVRLGENSKLNISELMVANSTGEHENSAFKLLSGNILVWLKNKNKKANIKFDTPFVSMGIRGTFFTVITNGSNYSFLGVKNGTVSANNLANNKNQLIGDGVVYLSNGGGEEKVQNNPAVINALNWDLEASNNVQIDIDKIANEMTSFNESNTLEGRLTRLQKLIAKFNNDTRLLKNDIDSQKIELVALSNNNLFTTNQLESDILCLEQGKGKCELKNEKYLLEKGFPNDFGNPKYVQSLISELKKHKVELETNAQALKSAIEKSELEYNKRQLAQAEIEAKLEKVMANKKSEELYAELEKTMSSL